MWTIIDLTAIINQLKEAGQVTTNLAHEISLLARDAIESIKSLQDRDFNEIHLKSACFSTLTCSLEEFIINSIDAGATQITIAFNIEIDKISIRITDNGRGFPPDKVSTLGPIPYELDRKVHGTSFKFGDHTRLGGQNISLLQTATVLQRNGGNLLISNIIVADKITGACLLLESSLVAPTYTLADYQLEHQRSTSTRPVSEGASSPQAIGSMLGSISMIIAAKRAAKEALDEASSFSGSSFAGSPAGFGGSFSPPPAEDKGSPVIGNPVGARLPATFLTPGTVLSDSSNPAATTVISLQRFFPLAIPAKREPNTTTVTKTAEKENTTPVVTL